MLAASSCQLLAFLAAAARARIDVISYEDEALGVMDDSDPPARIARIELRPHITVEEGPSDARVRRLVDAAHRSCYIANSLRGAVEVRPRIAFVSAR